jgi:3-deoxy-D-manno-octulosonic-acid transferase
LIRALYRVLVWLALPFAILRLLWRARLQPAYLKNLSERFGFSHGAGVERPIWIHAVSVGETRAAEPLIRAIRKRHPAVSILLTCTTPTGRTTGEQIFRGEVRQAYLPFDLPISVRRFLKQYRPKLGVLMETELWPHLIEACHDLRVPLYLVNARLSERSARRYQRLGSFASHVLRKIDTVAAQADADAQRFVSLGATNVKVCGNLKFDRGPSLSDLDLAKQFRDLVGERSVIVAATTGGLEERRSRRCSAAAHSSPSATLR